MDALKEWATIVKALEGGDQTVILRKGGILETDSGFKIESKKFLLFPTFEHQDQKHIKLQYQKYLDEARKNPPTNSHNKITSYAEVLADIDIDSKEKINALSSFHIWSDSYVKTRVDWMPDKPIKAVFLRVFRIPELEVPIKSENHGCKSWIDINANIASGKAVLSDTVIDSKLKEFKEIVN